LLAGPRTALTDESGAFRLERLPPGRYSLIAAAGEWRGSERSLVLDFAGQESVELLVSPATRLTGSVRAGGANCQLGAVQIDGPSSAVQPVTADGRVEFLGVLPGVYQLHVSCASALDWDDELEIGLEPVTRDWDLERGLSITGVAVGASGAPLAGAQIQVDPIGELAARGSVACTSDDHGAFECSGLLPGAYACQLRDDVVDRSDRVQVNLADGSPPPSIVLRARPAASLRVRVEASAALQLDALTVLAKPKGKAPLVAQRKGEWFVWEALPLGRYEVLLDPDVSGARRWVELSNTDARVELTLSGVESRALSGRVVDESGGGMPDVWLRASGNSLYGALRPAPSVMSDADGKFSLPGLLPGHYELSASSSLGQTLLDVLNDGRPVTVAMSAASSSGPRRGARRE
jgi:protocatechuate 3,4-dioxygenase beta subunit